MKQTVYFERANGQLIAIDATECAENKCVSTAFAAIKHFCKEHNYHIPYMRAWDEDRQGQLMTCIDVGSHVEFFLVHPPLNFST